MDKHMLRVENLSKFYGRRVVVKPVSFEIKQGEAVALLGRNGAGKSTMIKMLCQLIRPSSGQVWIHEKPIFGADETAVGAAIGAVIEAPRFYPHLSIYRNLWFLASLRGVASKAVVAMLEEVDLGGKVAHTAFAHCSQGMKQRLGLAAAFLHNPYLVILDEPTNGLDPVGSQRVHKIIERLRQNHGSSVLLCTHLLPEVETLCSRALVMEQGSIVLNHALHNKEGMEPICNLFTQLVHKDDAPNPNT